MWSSYFSQSLVSLVNGFQEKLSGLEDQAAQLELVGSDASKATISRSMTTVWQRWTRLRSVARGQERVLEDTAQEWRTFREKVRSQNNRRIVHPITMKNLYFWSY